MRFVQLCLVLVGGLLFGCAGNPYANFYKPSASLQGQPAQSAKWYVPSSEPPRLIETSNMQAESGRLWEEGYNQIGVSSFDASLIASEQALEHAAHIGAALAVIQASFKETQSGTVPMTLPTQNYSTTTFNAGGVSGTAQTTTYGSQTVHIPYSVDRYNYLATFWAKSKPGALGVLHTDLPDEDRVRLQRNTGVKIAHVRKGSPAFIVGILKGDIVVALNQESVVDKEGLSSLLKKYAGQVVEISLIRYGQEKTISVQLNDPGKTEAAAPLP